MTFKEVQKNFAHAMRAPEGEAVCEGVDKERIDLYRALVYGSNESVLCNVFPIVKNILGETDWHALVRDFLKRHRATQPKFQEIPEAFMDFIQVHALPIKERIPFLLELAHFEWLELALAISADEVVDVDAKSNVLTGIPVLNPTAMMLFYHYSVHTFSKGMGVAAMPEQPTYLVGYRDLNDTVRFQTLNTLMCRLLHCLQEGKKTGVQILSQLAETFEPQHAETIHHKGRQALENLCEAGIIVGATHCKETP